VADIRSLFRLNLLANHYPQLHGLRVLAILSVIQIHLGFEASLRGVLPGQHPAVVLSQRIWFGMDLFFLLSGFLIGNILLASRDRGTGGLLRFYGRRAFRIVPLYYAVLTLLAALAPIDPLQRANLWREYAYLTNYTDTAHVVMFWGWSLCVEEHFYLLVPLLVLGLTRLGSHRARLALLGALWLSCGCVRLAIGLTHSITDLAGYFRLIYFPTHTRYDTLVAGVALAYVVRTWEPQLRSALARRGVRIASIGLSVALFGALIATPPTGVWGLLAIGTVTSVAWANLVVYLLFAPSLAARALAAPVFLRLATLGYGVYLVHMPLVLLVGVPACAALSSGGGATAPALWGGVLAVFAASLLYAYALHLVVEKPALWARDRVAPAR
jgi:peptidoglycan/LPS O-acetylase OafA/YrhL